MTYKKQTHGMKHSKKIRVQCRLFIMIKNYDDDKFLALMLASFCQPMSMIRKPLFFAGCLSLPITRQEIVVRRGPSKIPSHAILGNDIYIQDGVNFYAF